MHNLLNPSGHWRSLQIRKPSQRRSDSPRYRTPAPSNILATSFSNVTNMHLPLCTKPAKPCHTSQMNLFCFLAPQLLLFNATKRHLQPNRNLISHILPNFKRNPVLIYITANLTPKNPCPKTELEIERKN